MFVVYRQCDRKGPAWVVFLVFSISNLISNDTIFILKKTNNETPLSQRVQFLRKKKHFKNIQHIVVLLNVVQNIISKYL